MARSVSLVFAFVAALGALLVCSWTAECRPSQSVDFVDGDVQVEEEPLDERASLGKAVQRERLERLLEHLAAAHFRTLKRNRPQYSRSRCVRF